MRALTEVDREAVIAFAYAHLGMGETPMGSNITVPGRWYGIDGPWCAMGVSWDFYMTLGFSPFPASTSKGFAECQSGLNWFHNQGKWASSSTTPRRGWLIFFDWNGDGHSDHVGLVLGARGPRDVDTIEDNVSDRSELHTRRGTTIMGYGIIDYTASPGVKPFTLTRTLKEGLHGEDVRYVQHVLNAVNGKHRPFNCSAGTEDGQYGPATATAVRHFKSAVTGLQKAFHQPVTFTTINGDVGPVTLGALEFWR